jgi:acetyl esterase/lipase
MGDKSDPYMFPLLSQGFAVASINYRLSQVAKFPAQLDDCKAAVRWLRANAAKYDLRGDRIAAAGASAGGHLVALLGTTGDRPEREGSEGVTGVPSNVQAVVDYFGPTDFINWTSDRPKDIEMDKPDNPVARLLGVKTVIAHPDLARAASPIYFIDGKTCPFFIIHGDLDTVVPLRQSIAMNDALQKAGIESSLVVVKGVGHGFIDPPSYQQMIKFLKAILQRP